ncbi:FAD-binding oxidoreductase [Arthrobacter sp. ISL-30]|uniref:NAD(P)/FAD-dependent oxidoreductase n=1 Tax=Arthrobacter sp. ISL-30 TaxID=2819109 RepID=UPI001BE6B00D|nr:FAD-dependent oxidoreductase [Arthrobacter sp. ISL-30]MBT2514706.1 FAD-binding oxidoreductase [Arthrobacter sp. ISL-30]
MGADTLATGDIVVVGAGIVGLCTAWELRKRGFDVVVVEQRFPGYGASGRNAGAIWLQTRRAGTELALAKAGNEKYKEFLREFGDVFDYRNQGGLFFFENDEQGRILEDYVSDRRAAGLDITMISREEALKQSSILPDTAIGAVFCADDAQIDGVQFVNALAAACVRAGIRKFENTSVLSTLRQGDTVIGVRSVRGEIHASGVVWATGAWSTNLRAEGIDVPIETARVGQMLTQPVDTRANAIMHGPRGVYGCGALTDLQTYDPTIFAIPNGAMLARPDAAAATLSVGYDDSIAQNRGGSMFIGNSLDGRGSLNPHISINATNAMVSTTLDRYQSLADYGVTGLWAGLGSETSDHLPIVDRADGSYINVGHAWGVASGPICGQVMAEVIAGEDSGFAGALKMNRQTLTIDTDQSS